MAPVDIASWILLMTGAFFCVVGGIGLHRLPDFFSRMHGAGITDTLGAGLVILGAHPGLGVRLPGRLVGPQFADAAYRY